MLGKKIMIRGKILCWNILWKEENKSNSLRLMQILETLYWIFVRSSRPYFSDKDASLKYDTQNYCNEFVQISLTQMY